MLLRTLVLVLVVSPLAFGQDHSRFNHWFTGSTLRFDFYHTGTKTSESFSPDEVVDEGSWPGSRNMLVDTLNLGEYQFRVYDRTTGQLLYSRGYSTIFNEWQTTDEAGKGVTQTFSESVRFPRPRRAVQLTIARRDRQMLFRELFSTVIDPADPTQINKERRQPRYTVTPLVKNGDPATKVDIVILGDGYTQADLPKFRADAKHYNDLMFATAPFSRRAKDFNVWLVEVVSEDRGIDIPDKDLWRRNALDTRYNTFGSPRYALSLDNKAVRDAAAEAPYDFICILLNDVRYGGGGIYELYATTYAHDTTKGQQWQSDYVYVHEFGHSFAGLGDEYYSSDVAYTDFYPKGVEPWEPNVTALVEKKNLKWKAYVSEGVPIPSPWEKAEYDSVEALRGKLDRLAPDYYAKREPLYRASMEVLKNPKYAGKVGAFEGAGYAAKGLYRPAVDCRMFSLSLVDFDPVCSAAIERKIDCTIR